MSVTVDLTTDAVCVWLVAHDKKFTRLNLDIERIIEIDISLDKEAHFILKFNSMLQPLKDSDRITKKKL